jgi:thioredoxin-like negative regulator of GroEL
MEQIADLNEFASFIDKGDVIIKFSLPGCYPCKQLTPRLVKFSQEHSQRKYKLGEIDISKNDMGDMFDIHNVPVVHVYHQGLLRLVMKSRFDELHNEIINLSD